MPLIHLVSNHFSRPVDDASQRGRENCARGVGGQPIQDGTQRLKQHSQGRKGSRRARSAQPLLQR